MWEAHVSTMKVLIVAKKASIADNFRQTSKIYDKNEKGGLRSPSTSTTSICQYAEYDRSSCCIHYMAGYTAFQLLKRYKKKLLTLQYNKNEKCLFRSLRE